MKKLLQGGFVLMALWGLMGVAQAGREMATALATAKSEKKARPKARKKAKKKCRQKFRKKKCKHHAEGTKKRKKCEKKYKAQKFTYEHRRGGCKRVKAKGNYICRHTVQCIY